MFPFASGFFGLLVMVLTPVVLLGLFAWVVAALAVPRDDAARRIARERFARGEISSEELGLLLQAL